MEMMMEQDMSSTSEVERCVAEAVEKLGGIDIIIANAVSSRFPQVLLL
jgi:NAD(P)-dependent dehydrogenase (short-subunit alcohol dehydrogenase family)